MQLLIALLFIVGMSMQPGQDRPRTRLSWNLEDNSRPISALTQAPKGDPLRVRVTPSRIGSEGLAIDVELANTSVRDIRVPRLGPIIYQIEFRDKESRPFSTYRLPLIEPAKDTVEDLVTLAPTNRLSITFELPTFYKRFDSGATYYCRLRATHETWDDKCEDVISTFNLESPWVAIPRRAPKDARKPERRR